MAKNDALLIAAPMLQDLLVDKDGTPMAGGTITLYVDTSRTTLKNWYYQTGTAGNYLYITLPNPLTLSSAGTITDVNGVDTIPFFYPYSEADETVPQKYYITIVNHAQTNQITRQNFPYISQAGGVTPTTVTDDLTNLIVNNGFWRNIQPNYVNVSPAVSVTLSTGAATTFLTQQSVSIGSLTTVYAGVVAPSQHDGFSFPDIQFIKNNLSANDTLTFTPFPLANSQTIANYITPEYYINHTSSSQGTGESLKCYQFPIALHINNLANANFTVSIQAQNASGGGTSTGQNVISLYILQYTGTGTTSPNPTLIANTTITLDSAWTPYTLTSTFPSTEGLTLGQGEDDALYLQIQMPLNLTCSINFTKPSIYLTTDAIADNEFQTYDVVDSVINSPRTGDIRTSVNSFYPFGWIPMNDGVIALANPGTVISTITTPGYSRANADAWPLFNLLWTLGKPYDSGSTFNPISQMWSNNGTALSLANYGASAYADFIATSPSKALQLTLMFGKVMMGTVPTAALMPFWGAQSQGVTASNSAGNLLLTPSSITPFWQGAPIMFTGTTLPGNIVANAVYYVTDIGGGTFNVATTYLNAIAGTPIVAYSSTGTGVIVNFDPTGSSIGQYVHTQTISEMPSHNHGAFPPATGFAEFTGAGNFGGAAGNSLLNVSVTGLTGGGAAFNITQPGVFYNIFMKL